MWRSVIFCIFTFNIAVILSVEVQCGVNEEYVDSPVCRPETCSDLGYPLPCLQLNAETTSNLGPGCVCKTGYVRNSSGACVSDRECPSCGGDSNAQSGCGVFCKTCDNYNESVACIDLCEFNACDCKEGYIYDTDGKKCVLPGMCPVKCPGKNTEYACSQTCPPQTCESIGKIYHCPLIISNENCKKECRCKQGYYKNKIGECISKEQCEQCKGPNEYFTCGPECDNVCSELSERNQTNCDILNIVCNEKCYCEEGYARDASNTCIPISKCPECPANAEYVDCPDAICRPTTCSQVGYPIACPSFISCPSKPGCVCKQGYVTDDSGKCISVKKCPSCGGDKNAVSGCGVNCNKKCPGHEEPCTKICNFNSCDCKDGFLLDTNINKCVCRDQCTPKIICRPDEEFDGCVNRGCGRFNCSQPGVICIDLIEGACRPGCRCRDPLLRTDDGRCVPSEECPPIKNPSCPGDEDNNDDTNDDENDDDNNDVNNEDNETDNKIKELIAGNGVFTAKFLYESAKNNPGKSVVGSPFSVVLLLAQLALFAASEALEQLYALLNLKTPQQIRGSVPPMLTSLNGEQNITLTIAEKVFGSKDYALSQKFIEVSRSVFEAEGQNLDYSNPQAAAKIINDWVASKTNNLIQNLVPADALGPDTRLVLTNAIYFKANWSKPFKKENTAPKDFHVSNSDTVTVQMMNQVGRFKYGVMPESKAQVIELPYVNENIVFLVLLPPNTADGMDNLLKEQLNFTSITSIRSNLRSTQVNLSLPKFETETSTDVQDILEKANVTKIFNPQGSGLQGMLEKPEDVYVSRFLQKAKILVFEEGAEAAAANAIIVGVTSVGIIEEPTEFNCNRPFVYYLWHKDNPLFCGLNNGPE